MSSTTTTTTIVANPEYATDVNFEAEAQYMAALDALFGGKLMNFGPSGLIAHCLTFVKTWGTYHKSIDHLMAVMTAASTPGVFLAGGKTRTGKQGTDLGPKVLALLPKLDATNPEIAKSIAATRSQWGEWAKVNNRMCSFIWLTCCEIFYGLNVTSRIDSWVKSHGTVSSIASRTKPSLEAFKKDTSEDRAIQTEFILVGNAQMVIEWAVVAKELREELHRRVRPIRTDKGLVNMAQVLHARQAAQSSSMSMSTSTGGI